jgi:hypothetical protein
VGPFDRKLKKAFLEKKKKIAIKKKKALLGFFYGEKALTQS